MENPILITGTGRSGTTIFAKILSLYEEYLYVEEPNFITDLFIPLAKKKISEEMFLDGLANEGWRGSMKFCRMMAEMYPTYFGENASRPIRVFMGNVFQDITSFPQKDDLFSYLKKSLEDIVKYTCSVTSKTTWLLKQPSAICYWEDLLSYWPELKIIIVCRDLEYVMLSRMKRGFQANFIEALDLCRQRLFSAVEACHKLSNSHIMIFNIKDAIHSRDFLYYSISGFLEKENHLILKELEDITYSQLNAIGDPNTFFSKEQLLEITDLKEKINNNFDKEIV